MEILCYGIVYLICREKFPQTDKQLLNAHTIRLRVLAPSGYYLSSYPNARQTLLNLQSNISAAIQKFAAKDEVKMDFCFCEVPDYENLKIVDDPAIKKVAEIIVSRGTADELPPLSQ